MNPYMTLADRLYQQGPDAVHIQQVGQRELRRAPALTQKALDLKKKENALLQKAGIKAHL